MKAEKNKPLTTPSNQSNSSSTGVLTICTRFKNCWIKFRTKTSESNYENSQGSMESEIHLELDVPVQNEPETNSPMMSALSSPSNMKPLFLDNFNCIDGSLTPVFTPMGRPEPIIIDMNDFELIFGEPEICEICRDG